MRLLVAWFSFLFLSKCPKRFLAKGELNKFSVTHNLSLVANFGAKNKSEIRPKIIAQKHQVCAQRKHATVPSFSAFFEVVTRV